MSGQYGLAVVPGPAQAAYPPMQPTVLPLARNARDMAVIALATAVLAAGLPLLMSPFAWGMAVRALRQIRSAGGRLQGESQARTALVTAIIGTVVLAMLLLLATLLLVLALNAGAGPIDPGTGTPTGIDV